MHQRNSVLDTAVKITVQELDYKSYYIPYLISDVQGMCVQGNRDQP